MIEVIESDSEEALELLEEDPSRFGLKEASDGFFYSRERQEIERLASLADILALRKTFSPVQLAYVTSNKRFRCALCGRRAGKTHAALQILLEAALAGPYGTCLFITDTRVQAKRIAWARLIKIDRQLGLGCSFNMSALEMRFPNGSIIRLAGCPDPSHIDQFRGEAFRVVIIDEAGSFGEYIRELVYDVLEPAVLDELGAILLQGTPGVVAHGLFFDLTQGPKPWPTHRWTVLDNYAIPHAAKELADKLERRGWTQDNPTFIREDLGQWSSDLSMLVYSGYRETNLVQFLPSNLTTFVLGIDLGTSQTAATTAMTVMAYSRHAPEAYVVESRTYMLKTPTAVAMQIKRLQDSYRFTMIVMDPGGLGGGYVREMRERYAIPVLEATKDSKAGNIELLNGDMKEHMVLLLESATTDLTSEMKVLAWANEDRIRPRPGMPNHCSDSFLYAWRAVKAYAWRPADVALTEEQKAEKDLEDSLSPTKECVVYG